MIPAPSSDNEGGFRIPLWVWGGFALVALVSIVVGVRALPILAGLVFPPTPPFPPSAVERSHSSDTYGVDQWIHETSTLTCELVAWYRTQGATCQTVSSLVCEGSTGDLREPLLDAQCRGSLAFSIFTMRWQADLSGAQIATRRVIDWSGQSPTASVPSP